MARIGVIGTGWGARVQVPVFREAGHEVVGIAGHDREKTKRTASELGVDAFDDWQALLASPADLVTITTPPSHHLQMALAAFEAGKHVICEKPTALDATQAEQLLQASREHHGKVAIIDHELRFLPAWRAARERIATLGGVRYVEVRYSSPSRGERARGWNWWSDAAQGGGILGAVGSHSIDSVRYLVGEIEAVQAMLTTVILQRPVPGIEPAATRDVTADDFAAIHLRLRSGAVAAMTFSVVASGPDEPSVTTIHCEEGALRLTGEELLFARRGEAFARVAGNDLAKRPGNSAGGAFGSGTYHLGLALRAALGGGDRDALAPAATFADGLAQQRVLDAARRSSENEGRWETL